MDDGVFPLDNALGGPSQSPMDLDFMNELLLEGCWLEMSDGSSFLHQTPSSYGTFYDSSYPWPLLEICNSSKTNPNPNPNLNPSQKNTQEQTIQSSDLLVNSPIFNPLVANLASSGSLAQPNDVFRDGSELNRVFWIGPRANPTASSVMERLIKALSYIKDSTLNTNMLVQIWLPVNRGETRVLTTSQQPFEISSRSSQLESYRGISVNYQFAAEEDSKVSVGLPGRVFLGKVPEWTPDVRFFRAEEYPRVGHAQQCDVRGTLALPVFEQESRNCLGVIEVVMTTQKVNYRTELESVCRALEAVHLRSSEFLRSQNIKEYNSSYKAALPEILQVLKAACETHSLPLAQTWVPCIQQGKQGCRHSDTNLVNCVSTIDFACFVADPSIQGFHEACSEHHLLKPKGVVGKAFTTNQPCFCADVTAYSKTEYPLSHYAMMFNLCAVVAIRLRCIYTCNSDFVLEFFLPKDCRAPEEQKKMLTSLSVIIQRVCRSLRVVTDKEVEEEAAISINNLTVPKLENTGSVSSPQDEPSGSKRGPILGQDKPIVGESEFSSMGKQGEKKRSKAEKSITLDVLRQHFAGSLKDAAKSIGVCPTTLKRICRQHGIKRWPSRKIKKVGHSLQKLQVVIDSVQGASGAFQIGSFYSNFPDITSPNLSERSPFSTAKPCQCSQPSNQDPEGSSGAFSPQTAASKSPSSSCSQTSSSSQCCSSGTQQQTWNSPVADDSLTGENSNTDVLKRAKSEAELHKGLNQESTQLIIRSQSQKTLFDHQNTDVLPPFPKFGGADFLQEGDALRVKVTYGEEKIRFRMLKSWRFKELVHEVVRRFNIGDIGGFHLKYLDDDSEWVLLTCDADVEECIDIYRSSNRQTIKLSLQVSHNHSRSSVGSNGHL